MTLSNKFNADFQSSLFEVLAAVGLGVNALVASSAAPLNSSHLHLASFLAFGIGLGGLSIAHALPHAEEQNIIRKSITVYGGLILLVSVSAIFGSLAVFSQFDNLLAILLIAGLAGAYLFFWKRFKTYDRADLWFSS
jgi:hypothetical protein